jgi:hypothetical protein
MTAFADAILACIVEGQRRFIVEQTGEIFEGITETDLARALRERGWRLPRFWLSEVEDAGFTAMGLYRSPHTIRTYFDEAPELDPRTGRPFRYDSFQRRALGDNTTIIRL